MQPIPRHSVDRFSFNTAITICALIPFTASSQPLELKAAIEVEDGHFGGALATVPDVDGDGIEDFVVGGWWSFLESIPESSQSAFVFGSSSSILLQVLVSPNEENDGNFGFAVSGTPDANGNGTGDVLVGAYKEDAAPDLADSGRAYILDGGSGHLLRTLDSPNAEIGGSFGRAVAGIPDVNSDGRGEVLVGAEYENPGASPTDAGRAYIFDGGTGTLLHTLVSPNDLEFGNFGNSVSGIPDVNGDGVNDVIVGARQEAPGGSPIQAGRAYIFDASTGQHLKTLISPHEQQHGTFGTRVAGIPDLNGNGRGEAIVSAIGEGAGGIPQEAGKVYVFDGSSGELLHDISPPRESPGGFFGWSISSTPDMSGDGSPDILVGSDGDTFFTAPANSGSAYAFDGVSGALIRIYSSPNEEANGRFGSTVCGLPDTNGDGRAEIVVGARDENPTGDPADAGRVYLFPSSELDVSPQIVSFGEQEIGEGPTAPISVTIENSGTQNLHLGCPGVELIAGDISDFAVSSISWTCSTDPSWSPLPPGTAREFTLSFDPIETGERTANLVLTSDDPNMHSVNMILKGIGVEFTPTPTQTSTATGTPTPTQSADLHTSGWIDMMDLFVLSAGWEATTGPEYGDLNGNGTCGPEDLLILLGDWHTTGRISIEMVTIPAQSFMMGNSGTSRDQNGCWCDDCSCELPRHQVDIGYPFQMGKYEVTNSQYAITLTWANERGYLTGSDGEAYAGWDVYHNGKKLLKLSDPECDLNYTGTQFVVKTRNSKQMDNHPVKGVTWYGAVVYCNCLSTVDGLTRCYDLSTWTLKNARCGGYRLPSEAEWECACRGSSSNPNRYAPFSFGDDPSVNLHGCDFSPLFDQYMVWCGNDDGWTEEVGSKLPNESGLCDMHGNVAEWCQDEWHQTYSGAPTDGSAWEFPVDEPPIQDRRVNRGGDWSIYFVRYSRSAARSWSGASTPCCGFRLARSLEDFDSPTATPSATPMPATPTPSPTRETITIDIPNLPTGARPMRLVRIPAGTFQMGSPNTERERYEDWEGPVHAVTITNDFYIGETEVTQAQWQALMGSNPSSSLGVGNDYPVYYVSWNDITQANGFLDRLDAQTSYSGSRLPTEAEWEYACRSGTQTRFHFGDSLGCDAGSQDCAAGLLPGNRSDYVWYDWSDGQNGYPGGPKEVATLLPNQFGLYDMSGNLWEWCQDWFQEDFYRQPGATYPNPLCTNSASRSRVVRGGDWNFYAWYCRSAMRMRSRPHAIDWTIGFRVVLPLSSKPF